MKHLWIVIALGLLAAACVEEDKTAEVACANASCPPGTLIDLSASSASECAGDAGFERNVFGGGGNVSARCFTDGGCTYTLGPQPGSTVTGNFCQSDRAPVRI